MTDLLSYFPEPFLEDIVQGRCLPFIGAGFSLNAKIPDGKQMLDWDGLGKKIQQSLPDYQYTTALEALSAYCHEFTRVKLVEFMSKSLLVTSIQPGKAHEEFCQLPFEQIITTNFDFLLEQAYSKIGKYCIPQISEEQLAVCNSRSGINLLKIHGDLHHPNRLIVTEEDYDSFINTYPLLATHLSSLLINHTALFIGYSLDDPDFRQIWQMVKERLGSLRRPAYVLQIGASTNLISRYERRGVKVINIPKIPNKTYGEILESIFISLREYWSSKLITLSTSTEPEPQTELSLPLFAKSRLMFFSVPSRSAAFYKTKVYPLAEKYGFTPVMAYDVVSPGDNITAKTYALIDRAAVIVADLSSKYTISEVNMAINKGMSEKPIILIADEQTTIPLELSNRLILRRPTDIDEYDNVFSKEIERFLVEIFDKLSPELKSEPARLLHHKEYRAAVISALSILEIRLKQVLEKHEESSELQRTNLNILLNKAQRHQLLTPAQWQELRKYTGIRNSLIHSFEQISYQTAKTIVNHITDITQNLNLDDTGE